MSCCFGDDSVDESLELLSESRKYDEDTEATCCSTKPAPLGVERGWVWCGWVGVFLYHTTYVSTLHVNVMSAAADLKVVKRGYLCLQDPTTWCKRWRKVYAVLYEHGFLAFGPSERDMVQFYLPSSQLALYGSAVVFVAPPKIPAFLVNRVVLEINTPKRTLFVYAPTAASSKSWAQAIQNVAQLATQALNNTREKLSPPLLLLRDVPEAGSASFGPGSRSSSQADVMRKLTEKSESQRHSEEVLVL